MRDRLTIYEQNVTLIVKPNKKNGENKMLESLKKKTLLGNLWCIIVLGIVTLSHPGDALSFLCVMFGIPVLADGLFKIQIAMDSRQFGIRNWWLVLVLAALTCVVGVVLVFRPMTGVRALTALMGLSLLCDGVLNLSVALCTVKIVDYQRPDVIETDDYEIGKDE